MTTLLRADARTAPLGRLGSLGPRPDGELGRWEAAPGTETDVEVDEVFVVLAGAVTVALVGLARGPG